MRLVFVIGVGVVDGAGLGEIDAGGRGFVGGGAGFADDVERALAEVDAGGVV